MFLASALCKYTLRKGDLFVLSWEMVRRVRRGSISSELLMCVEVINAGIRHDLQFVNADRGCKSTIWMRHTPEPVS